MIFSHTPAVSLWSVGPNQELSTLLFVSHWHENSPSRPDKRILEDHTTNKCAMKYVALWDIWFWLGMHKIISMVLADISDNIKYRYFPSIKYHK